MTNLRQPAWLRRTMRAVPLVCVALGLSLWCAATPASAHATLERAVPAANAHLDAEPRTVVLTFDEAVNLALGTATVVGPAGARVDVGYTQGNDGRTVTMALRQGAGNGSYAVSYRVTSLDSHPVSGGFVFQVGNGTAVQASTGTPAAAAPPANSADAPEHTSVRVVYAVSRGVGFAGLLLLIGGMVFWIALWPAGLPVRRVSRLVWLGYCLVAVASLSELLFQVPYASGASLTSIPGAGLSAVLATTFGVSHLIRLAALATAAPVLFAMLSPTPDIGGSATRPPARSSVMCAILLALALLATWAYSGHAGSTDALASVPSDVIHLAAVSVWLGGLVVLLVALLPMADEVSLRAALPRWSWIAMVSVAALTLSGTMQALVEVGGWSGLTGTTYGRLLLAKIALLTLLLAIANYSRLSVRRHYSIRRTGTATRTAALGPDPVRGPSPIQLRRLRYGVAAETVLAAAAVAVATVLIETVPGRVALADPSARVAVAPAPVTRTGAYLAAVRRGDVVIHVKVDPSVAGIQYIYLGASRPGGHPVRVLQWTLSVGNSALGLEYVHVPVLVDSGVGHHYVYGSFTMPAVGTWTIQVTARTTDVDETIATCRLRIKS